MEKLGWRGVIYDAWWARFKSDQEGVVVYEGGKECETTDEAKDRIQIEVDKNASVRNTRKGYILFTQKGTNCTDIVCITQEAGGEYVLSMDNITLSECDTSADINGYNALLAKIRENTYESINGGERRLVQSWTGKEITSPKFDDYNPGVRNNYTAMVVDNELGASAQATVTITTAREEVRACTVTVNHSPADLKKITLTQSTDTPDRVFECDGGSVSYLLTKEYEINISNSYARVTYQKCGVDTRSERKSYTEISWNCVALDASNSPTDDSVTRNGNIVRVIVKNPSTKKVKITGTYSTGQDYKVIIL